MFSGKRIGRRRYTLTYIGILALKIIGLFALLPILVKMKLSAPHYLVDAAVLWFLIDVCMLPTFAGRLKDVSLSGHCLWLIYGASLFGLMIFCIIPTDPGSAPLLTEKLLNPMILFSVCALSLVWIIGCVIRIYLVFKKGEPHGIT